jgi:ketosteroid isomerase-like protein
MLLGRAILRESRRLTRRTRLRTTVKQPMPPRLTRSTAAKRASRPPEAVAEIEREQRAGRGILSDAMSQNVKVVRRMYEARDRGDAEGVLACFHPEVVLDARVRMDSGIVHGREQAGRVIGEWVGTFDDWREEIHEIRDLGSQVYVVATQRGRAKGSGIEVESRYALLYEVEGGQVTRMAMFDGEAEALAAAAAQE